MTKKNPTETAREIKTVADRLGWTISVRPNSVVTITKRFQAGSNDGFVECDMEYYSVLGMIPRTSAGSDWGTDGGGIGALSAIRSGVFTMNRSGCSKRVVNALAKIV